MSAKDKQSSLKATFSFAWAGIIETFKNERSFRIELVFALLAIIASVVLALEPLEWAVILLLIGLVLILELVNSALESLTDLASLQVHPLAKHAKDAMAGAVLLAAVGAAVIGLIIYASAALRLWG